MQQETKQFFVYLSLLQFPRDEEMRLCGFDCESSGVNSEGEKI